MTQSGRISGFASRLFLAQALVIVAGAGTLALVVFAIAPGIFHSHVRRAAGPLPDTVTRHIDEAFSDAVLVALGFAIAAALLAAVGMSAFLALRMARPVRSLALASQGIAAGRYSARAPLQGPSEVVELAAAFNQMAETLESSERRRRALLADVAHELRTPLATLQGYVEGLADGAIAPDTETWRVLDVETRRMHRLVEDLSTVSRAEEGQLELRLAPTAPGAVATTSVHAAQPRYHSKGVDLDLTIDRALPMVVVDPDRLSEVIANLLDNALRHTPAGERVEVTVTSADRHLEITVADTGDGIAPEHLDQVFERFFRTDGARARATGGSGIGLTISRAIVNAFGGEITAASDGLGKGSRFVVKIPSRRGRPEHDIPTDM